MQFRGNQTCVDLNRLADTLHDRQIFGKLESLIRRFHGKVSARIDLEQARRSVDQLNKMMRDNPLLSSYDEFKIAAGEALCLHAVVVYCRALVSNGAGRFRTGVEFPDQLMHAHSRISSLRNRRLCHYGDSTDEREASWSDDRAVLVLEGSKLHLRFATSRRGWDLRVVDDLDALTAYAIGDVARQAVAETEKIFDEIQTAADDPAFVDIVLGCKFEPRDFFASLEQADAMASTDIGPFSGVRFGVFKDKD